MVPGLVDAARGARGPTSHRTGDDCATRSPLAEARAHPSDGSTASLKTQSLKTEGSSGARPGRAVRQPEDRRARTPRRRGAVPPGSARDLRRASCAAPSLPATAATDKGGVERANRFLGDRFFAARVITSTTESACWCQRARPSSSVAAEPHRALGNRGGRPTRARASSRRVVADAGASEDLGGGHEHQLGSREPGRVHRSIDEQRSDPERNVASPVGMLFEPHPLVRVRRQREDLGDPGVGRRATPFRIDV